MHLPFIKTSATLSQYAADTLNEFEYLFEPVK